jgi:hypothetical protein
MSIKLLPAFVNSGDAAQAADGATGLVPLTRRAIAMRTGQISHGPSVDDFAWSSLTGRRGANVISGTPVEDSQSGETGRSGGEYVSGWAWSRPVERTAVAQYLAYAVGLGGWRGRLVDVYA